MGPHAGSDHSSVPNAPGFGWPENRDADLHFRKEGENVPVFRRQFGCEMAFGSVIAGIVDTGGTICLRCDSWGDLKMATNSEKWGDEVPMRARIEVVELFGMYRSALRRGHAALRVVGAHVFLIKATAYNK